MGQLNAQPVILLAERVDLVRQLLRLRDELGEGWLGADRLRIACAALQQDGNGGPRLRLAARLAG